MDIKKYYDFIKSVGEIDYTEQRITISCTNMDRLLQLVYDDGKLVDVVRFTGKVPNAKLENPDAKR